MSSPTLVVARLHPNHEGALLQVRFNQSHQQKANKKQSQHRDTGTGNFYDDDFKHPLPPPAVR